MSVETQTTEKTHGTEAGTSPPATGNSPPSPNTGSGEPKSAYEGFPPSASGERGTQLAAARLGPATKEIDGLEDDAERCSRYHQRRRAHYDLMHRVLMFFVIVSGSASFAQIAGHPDVFGALAAACGAIDLLWGVSDKARDHEMLHRRFMDVLIRIKQIAEPSAEWARQIHTELSAIYADEPPAYRVLNADCHNQVAQARLGKDAPLLTIPPQYRFFMNLFRFPAFKLAETPPSATARPPEAGAFAP